VVGNAGRSARVGVVVVGASVEDVAGATGATVVVCARAGCAIAVASAAVIAKLRIIFELLYECEYKYVHVF
jgi:hypothetical protein